MAEALSKYDPAVALSSNEAVEVFVTDALETGEVSYIAEALSVVARARGVSPLAASAGGLSQEQLDGALSDGANLTFRTVLAVMKSLGMNLSAAVRETPGAGRHEESPQAPPAPQAFG